MHSREEEEASIMSEFVELTSAVSGRTVLVNLDLVKFIALPDKPGTTGSVLMLTDDGTMHVKETPVDIIDDDHEIEVELED